MSIKDLEDLVDRWLAAGDRRATAELSGDGLHLEGPGRRVFITWALLEEPVATVRAHVDRLAAK